MSLEIELATFMLNGGVAVGVLVWFMFRMESVINNNTAVIQRVELKVENCSHNKKNKKNND